jgi:hypothetical protein
VVDISRIELVEGDIDDGVATALQAAYADRVVVKQGPAGRTADRLSPGVTGTRPNPISAPARPGRQPGRRRRNHGRQSRTAFPAYT